ncbi:hypothetical protein L2E82_30316 [Cichorium intybus]|uniref:Uncharacterized protein n=1 Tax=Cichorium intybus TaxID=13427 RepID=A0ACB9D023_CICIN|nr:hypothetical protein L2E82_30316 [Cichorium intybus]
MHVHRKVYNRVDEISPLVPWFILVLSCHLAHASAFPKEFSGDRDHANRWRCLARKAPSRPAGEVSPGELHSGSLAIDSQERPAWTRLGAMLPIPSVASVPDIDCAHPTQPDHVAMVTAPGANTFNATLGPNTDRNFTKHTVATKNQRSHTSSAPTNTHSFIGIPIRGNPTGHEYTTAIYTLDECFWCTHFSTTLDGNAGTWFKSLAPSSIRNFAELKEQFISNFMQLRKYRGDIREIIGCKQLEGETVRAYFKRFNEATLNVPGQNDNLVTGAFTHGLLSGPLSKKQEEGTAAKEAYLKVAATSSSKSRERYSPYPNDRRQTFRRGKPAKPFNGYYREDRRHRRTIHFVEKKLDQRIQRGNLNDIAKSIRPKNDRNDPPAKNKDAPKKGLEILMIHKHHRRGREQIPALSDQQISFSSRDKMPEGWNGDDPLIIQARIRDIVIHRVHIDSGSAADIMFEHCFRQLPREWRADLRPPAGNLTGFTGHIIIPTGMIYLPITIEDDKRKKTATLKFTVVRAPSEHNVILGRPAALYFDIVASTLHGIIKFPTEDGIATVLATPQKTLKCYQIMLPADIDGKRKRPREESKESRESSL